MLYDDDGMGIFVIDAVAHGTNMDPSNYASQELARAFVHRAEDIHKLFAPRDQPQWTPAPSRFQRATDADELAYALFAESRTDACIYHGLPLYGYFHDGGSPLLVGREMCRKWPGRVGALYGPISPWRPDAVDEVDRLAQDSAVKAIKIYPTDMVQGTLRSFYMDDQDLAFPLFERAQRRRLPVVAVHKAIPIGPVPRDPYTVTDIPAAAEAFPDLTFEIVHAGFAFHEEMAAILAPHPNVVLNLEATSAYLVNFPEKFAAFIAAFLHHAGPGGTRRLIWATGVDAIHPRPLLDAFWTFRLPDDLLDHYGDVPQLTTDIKRDILGGNIARILGLDIDALRRAAEGDEFTVRAALAEPWSVSHAMVENARYMH